MNISAQRAKDVLGLADAAGQRVRHRTRTFNRPRRADDETTERIRATWQDVLKIDDIDPDDDLFDLGGHSLTITRIIARIHQQLGVQVPLETFYDTHPRRRGRRGAPAQDRVAGPVQREAG